MRTNSESTIPCSFATRPFSIRSSKKARSSWLCSNRALKVNFSRASASVALSKRLAKAISGSIIQNSAVGIFRAERRPESIGLREREAVCLHVKLPRHRQERFTTKKILYEIDLALRRARQIGEVQRRYAE